MALSTDMLAEWLLCGVIGKDLVSDDLVEHLARVWSHEDVLGDVPKWLEQRALCAAAGAGYAVLAHWKWANSPSRACRAAHEAALARELPRAIVAYEAMGREADASRLRDKMPEALAS